MRSSYSPVSGFFTTIRRGPAIRTDDDPPDPTRVLRMSLEPVRVVQIKSKQWYSYWVRSRSYVLAGCFRVVVVWCCWWWWDGGAALIVMDEKW